MPSDFPVASDEQKTGYRAPIASCVASAARCCADIVGILFSPRTGAIFISVSNIELNYSERSHSLARGARGRISGNSKAGRYIRHRERELLEELGGEPTCLGRQYITDMARLECLKDQIETELHRDGQRDLPKLKAYRELVNALITMRRDYLHNQAAMRRPRPKPQTPTLPQSHFAADREAARLATVHTSGSAISDDDPSLDRELSREEIAALLRGWAAPR